NQAMFLGKIKLALVLLAVGLCALGAGLLTHRALAAPPAESPQKAGPQAPAKEPDKARAKSSVVVRGRVLDPAGNPARDAQVYLVYISTGKPKVRATTGADGRFRFTTTEADFRAYPDPNPWQYASIVAVAKGHGPAAAWPGRAEAVGDVQL